MPATVADFRSGITENPGVDLCTQWPPLVRAVQALTAYFVAKGFTGTEPNDVLTSISLGDAAAAPVGSAFRLRYATSQLFIDRHTAAGTFAAQVRLDSGSFFLDNGIDSGYALHLEAGAAVAQAVAIIMRDGTLAAGAGEPTVHLRKSTSNQLLLQTQNGATLTNPVRIERNNATSAQTDAVVINSDGSMTLGPLPSLTFAAGTGAVTINTSLLFPSGLVGSPGIAFGAEPDLGIYRAASAIGALVEGATEVLRWTGTGGAQVQIPAGTAAVPGLAFIGDTDTGLRQNAANVLAAVTGAAERILIDSTGVQFTMENGGTVDSPVIRTSTFPDSGIAFANSGGDGLVLLISNSKRLLRINGVGANARIDLGSNGSATAPCIAANSTLTGGSTIAADTGLFWNSTTTGRHYLGAAANANEIARFVLNNAGLGDRPQILHAGSGNSGSPSYSFVAEPTTGVMHSGSGASAALTLIAQGAIACRVTPTAVACGVGSSGAIGSNSAPAIIMGDNDTNTGFYKGADDDLRVAVASGELIRMTSGTWRHMGTSLGFYGVAAVARAAAYTATNVTTDRSYDANATSLDEVADVLGTLIADLRAYGLLQ